MDHGYAVHLVNTTAIRSTTVSSTVTITPMHCIWPN